MSDFERPDPDALLARAQADERGQTRGKLKIFFGASAGVGKTYAMLESARIQKAAGVDVVVGYVEPHGRKETEALLEGLEILPARTLEYRNIKLREFDLDAALARKPTLILVDELAHTNAEGSRHAKRWQDVEELLDAGINVYTTVNVQHLESQNDIVAQITGEIQRETIPDSVFEQADEVELIDLTVDELMQRLREGKVYRPQQAAIATEKFFRKGNLTALREMALRRTAERVDAQMQAYQRERAIADVWPAAERILVCIGPSALAQRLVRAAKRMATGLRAEWIVAFVESPDSAQLSPAKREQVTRALRLAEDLGAQTATLSGHNIADEVLNYARRHNISKIVVGKPEKPRWRELLFGSTVDTLVRRSGVIDVYVIHGEHDDTEPRTSASFFTSPERSPASAYAWSTGIIAACTVACFFLYEAFPDFDLANLIMFYLLGVVLVAVRFGRGPSVLASVLSVATFDFLFVPPRGTFAVSDVRYVLTFAIMLVTALLISNLTVRIRQQAESARQRERRTQELYDMSRELASTRGIIDLAQSAMRHIGQVFESKVTMLLPDRDGALRSEEELAQSSDIRLRDVRFAADERDRGVARWAHDHAEAAGLGTKTLASSRALYLPLAASRGTVGVLGVLPANPQQFQSPEQFRLLETFANQIALAIERAKLAEETEQAHVRIETEQLRNTLLSSVSHDLRTPLAAITGAASTMLEANAQLDAAAKHELTQSIYDEAERLNTLVRNLLDMTRLESGAMQVNKEAQPLEEVIGYVLDRMEKQLHGRDVTVNVPSHLPLIPLDSVLISQVFINLLENATKYTPAGTPIAVSAVHDEQDRAVQVEVADRGPGLPPGEEARIFDKFHRLTDGANGASSASAGAGLGLAICRAIIEAHGGRIWAGNREGGGAAFKFTLPLS
jgi:two-component system sensor histidine kinase KdpD